MKEVLLNQNLLNVTQLFLPKMRFTRLSIFVIIFSSSIAFAQKEKQYKINTIAFYNVENLFDYEDDPLTFDEEFTPEGRNNWTKEIYEDKLSKLARVISDIGVDVTGTAPAIIGVAEIENRRVLEDLVNEDLLVSQDYGIVHVDSPDRRGIDVALLYKKKLFTPTNYKAHELILYDSQDQTKRIYTRDQLLVSGMLDGEMVHLIVNHWPSRSGGEERSRPNRLKAAELNKKIMDSLFSEDPYAKIITMGDFNDDPTSPSVKQVLQTKNSRDKMKMKE